MVANDYLDADDLARGQRRSTPIGELLDDYLRTIERTSAAHQREIGRALRAFVTETRVQSPRDLEPRLIAAYLQRIIDSGRSHRTHNHHRSALSGFGKWLADFNYIEKNPVTPSRSLDHTKDRRRVSRPLTVVECDAMIAATICPTRQALYLFRVRTGVRVREASRLIWSDLDLGERVVNLRADVTKNCKTDSLPLTDDVCDLLLGLQRDALKGGTPLGPSAPVFGPAPDRRTWARDLKRAKVEAKTSAGQADPKCLRLTFNSHLERAGVDLTLTGLLMRHTPRGGLGLTPIVYGDAAALLDRKRQAVTDLTRWIAGQREDLKRKEA